MTQSRHYIVCFSFDQCLPLIAIPRSSWRSLKAFSVNCAKLGEGRVRQREFGRRRILIQVGDRRVPGSENIGRAMEQPSKRHLHWSRPSRVATCEKVEDWRGVKPPSGKKGT